MDISPSPMKILSFCFLSENTPSAKKLFFHNPIFGDKG